MALSNGQSNAIAELADVAELLPRLIASNEDETETFRKILADIAIKIPNCDRVLNAFDEDPLRPSW
jgi:hypothetical protein